MPSAHQNWQYLGASGYIGSYATTGGGGTPVVPRSDMDYLRLGVGKAPQAEYPDGYLGSIRSRRDDKGKPYATSDTVLDSLKARQTQRGYQRGVHKGERIDPGEYMWPAGLQPDRRMNMTVTPQENDGGLLLTVNRYAPKSSLAPHPHLVNDGKSNISANVPGEYAQQRIARNFQHLKPRWK